MKDYYKVLGVSRTASSSQIRQAYRALCKKYHPDRNPSPEATRIIQRVNEAYEVLSDTTRKAYYDSGLQSTKGFTASQAESGTSEVQEVFCQRCHLQDTSLRLSIFYDVSSFLLGSSRTPHVEILCAACRSKTSLAYNLATLIRGWWHPVGFFWTLHAVWHNTIGGQQPQQYNAAMLAALGENFYRKGRTEDAYVVFKRSLALRPNADVAAKLTSFSTRVKTPIRRPRNGGSLAWRAHPVFYNAPFVTVVVAGMVSLFSIVGSQSAILVKSKLWGNATSTTSSSKGKQIQIIRGTQSETVKTP